jgi:hypothetical protein
MNDHGHATRGAPGFRTAEPEEVPVSLDLAREDLYRLLDQLARTSAERHGELVRAFERAWETFKEETARHSGRAG